ncbi:MAG: tautomerase family protein [Candidatus Riflemargulisbacteria bacterium]
MPYVSIRVAVKLLREQKQKISEDVCESLEKNTGKPKDSVLIFFDEVDKENVAKGDRLLG